jgi:hypothetical protein
VDIWQLAVELEDLKAAGVANADLRSLLLGGLIERAREVTRSKHWPAPGVRRPLEFSNRESQ